MRLSRVDTFVLKLRAADAYLGALRDGSSIGESYQVRLPWRSLYSSRFETMIVKVTAEDGTVGWGEALAPVAPEVAALIVDLLLAPTALQIDVSSPAAAFEILSSLMSERGHRVGHQADALAALDIALWDLAGNASGRNIAGMVGTQSRSTIPHYLSGIPANDDATRVAAALELHDSGIESLKLHLGFGVETDLATVAALRREVPSLRIAVDAHWAYSREEANLLADELATLGAWYLEAPLSPDDISGHAALVARGSLPIAVGEALRNSHEFSQRLSAGALSIAQPDVGRTGLTEGAKILELADSFGVPVMLHHSVALGIALAAGLQLAASHTAPVMIEYQPSSFAVGARILQTEIAVDGAAFSLPAGAGLGVVVDETELREMAVSR